MSKVEQGEPQHRDTKEIVKFARELGVNLADSDWHIFEQFVDAAIRHAAASLPESQTQDDFNALLILVARTNHIHDFNEEGTCSCGDYHPHYDERGGQY